MISTKAKIKKEPTPLEELEDINCPQARRPPDPVSRRPPFLGKVSPRPGHMIPGSPIHRIAVADKMAWTTLQVISKVVVYRDSLCGATLGLADDQIAQ
ncbi:hypothetical protein EYZ11_011706 [Aspergillus tanneri]|uniref:Uncharacterized protein n=1 Tax=Aspergillus tanneri TaxID=1220188 RepID=A0A4S3J263_9EURO|nr:uncharacterized protein ATNIH1004_003479 [Aspergillus tanneri]KAA8650790.1 hypothetical protein ATNIH1004_003479 [Aspergillus tanneri]THC88846.1 hypothetical protein EYZ11_011706 [Aspergillus tanneri]